MRASTTPFKWQYHSPEEEIAYGPAGWLWDYLRFAMDFKKRDEIFSLPKIILFKDDPVKVDFSCLSVEALIQVPLLF